MTGMHTVRFSGFRAGDWAHFEAEGKPKAKPPWEVTSRPCESPKPVRPIQVNMTDRDLFRALHEAAKADPQGGRLWGLEWKLKARVMQLNQWAAGDVPLPHQSSLGQRYDRWKNRRDARRLFREIGESPVYFPAKWLFMHLNKLAAHYGIDARKYFKS